MQDGRKSFKGLHDHYLGPNNVDNLDNMAERKLTTTTYNGEQKRWNFKKYVKVHVDQHAVLETLQQQGTHVGIDNRSKVRHLCDGIKTSQLDTVKTRIMSDEGLRSDFSRCVSLFIDFLQQGNGGRNSDNVKISTVNTKGPHKSQGGKERDPEDRYYKPKEYKKLSKYQKRRLAEMREARGGSKHKSSGDKKSEIKKLAKKVTALAVSVQAAHTQDADEDLESVVSNTSDSTHESRRRPAKKAKKEKKEHSGRGSEPFNTRLTGPLEPS